MEGKAHGFSSPPSPAGLPLNLPTTLLKDLGLGTLPGTSPDRELAGPLQAGHVVLAEVCICARACVFTLRKREWMEEEREETEGQSKK